MKMELFIKSEALQKMMRSFRLHSHFEDYNSRVELLIMDNPQINNAYEWCLLGDDYYFARNGKPRSYILARACYEQALKLNPKHNDSLYSLGWLYEHGKGVSHDIDKAITYYTPAGLDGHYDSKVQVLKITNPQIKNADQWYQLGRNFYYGHYYYGRLWAMDHVVAHACYEQALKLNPKHNDSLYSLGWLYEHGEGVDQDINKAKTYYEQAEDCNSKVRLLRINNPEIKEADQWDCLGDDYYFARNGKEKDYASARVCYEQTIELNPKHIPSLYSLGWLYEHGEGVGQNISKAKTYYETAAQEGGYYSRVQLLKINNPQLDNADQWYKLGDDYHFERNGKIRDNVLARTCYEQAIKLNPKHTDSLYRLGWLYEQGEGVDKDITKAVTTYYEPAAQSGDYNSKVRLLLINNPEINNADQWYNLGDDYYFARSGKVRDYVFARACYEQALKLDIEHPNSNFSLAFIYHYSQGVSVDHEQAREYYIKALDKGQIHAKKGLKKLEKEVVLNIKKHGGDVDAKDKNNDTALHRAAKHKQLKNCALFIFLGASKDIRNARFALALANMSQNELDKIDLLQGQISELASVIKMKAPKVIAHRIFIDGFMHDEQESLDQLEILYRNIALSPLLDLAKLAVLALHDLSGRTKFKSIDDYDSDDDDKETLIKNQYLTIRINPKSSDVSQIASYGQNGLEGKRACGVYKNNLTDPNTIYVAGKRSLSAERRSTFIHELIHFIAKEVYKNDYCEPYAADDNVNRDRFTEIARILELKKDTLDPVLQGAFSYQRNLIPGELLVRVGQMIVTYSDGMDRIKVQALELWNYYNDVFLDKVRKHVSMLESRALSGCPLEQLIDDNKSFCLSRHHHGVFNSRRVQDTVTADHKRCFLG